MVMLSIIIPFYNVEKYIAECLDSVFNQDISEKEYEVICVNDGSKDGSRNIVCGYMRNHSNLRLIDHPCNMKLGAARNTGRKSAKGKYIWYVDSDDMIASNCLKHILQVCEERNLDVLEICYVNRYEDMLDSTSMHQMVRDDEIYTGPEYLEKFHVPYSIGGICGIWRKVYKHSFLDTYNIYSPPINLGEDEAFAVEVFGLANRVSYLGEDYYFYRRNDGSLWGMSMNTWPVEKWYEQSIISTKFLHEAFCKVKANYSMLAQQKIKEMIRYDATLWRNLGNNYEIEKQFWKRVRNNFWQNRFIFLYLSKRCKIEYICKVLYLR